MVRYKKLRSPFDQQIIGKINEAGHIYESFVAGTNLEYESWLAEGNVPEPPDPLPPPPDPSTIPASLEERLQAAETLINLILDEEAQ